MKVQWQVTSSSRGQRGPEAGPFLQTELGLWPQDGLDVLDACPWCGSSSRKQLYTDLKDIVFGCAPGSWTLWRCSDCRSGYLDPRPDQATLYLAYQNYYTHRVTTDEQRGRRGWLALRNRLANGYRNRRYGTQHLHALGIGYWLLALMPVQRRSLDISFRYLPHPKETVSGRVLDIGCGNGDFLRLVAQAGWSCFGCDPDPVALQAASASGAFVRVGSAETWLDAAGSFDAVTMSHVLEHVPNPVGTLNTIHQLLRPGGFLYLDLPNIDASGHVKYERFWRGLETPRHLTLPSMAQLKETLRRIGYVDICFKQRSEVKRTMWLESDSLRRKSGSSDELNAAPTEVDQQFTRRTAIETLEFLTLTAKRP